MNNSIISEKQAAYLKGDSTINQLLYLINKIRVTWGNNKILQGLFLDISAAFDKIWHKALLAKLKQICIKGKFLHLFESYLTNRKQIVVVDGVKSDIEDVKAGCPQGSKLGPLLFIIFINDIQKDLESDILIFADDTTLLAEGKNSFETSAIINRDLVKIHNWATRWKVTFNSTKSKYILFSKNRLPDSPLLTFGPNIIDRVETHKHLGIILTYNLDWAPHVNYICLKANRKLHVLRSVQYLSRSTLDLLYKLTVRSQIDYGLHIFFHSLKQTEIRRLSQVQYRAGKLVSA